MDIKVTEMIKFLLLELHTLDLLRNFVLYTWYSRVGVPITSTIFKMYNLKLAAK